MGDLDRRDDVMRERFDQAVEAAARKAARQTALRATFGYFVLIVFLLIGVSVYQANVNARVDRAVRTVRAVNERLDLEALLQCRRVQLQRERTNVSEARQYLVLVNAVSNPRTPRAIKRRYTEIANTTTYDPPTNCPLAVAYPRSYERPSSRPFSRLGMRYAERVVAAARAGQPQPTP